MKSVRNWLDSYLEKAGLERNRDGSLVIGPELQAKFDAGEARFKAKFAEWQAKQAAASIGVEDASATAGMTEAKVTQPVQSVVKRSSSPSMRM